MHDVMAIEIAFWVCVGLILYAHAGYLLVLWLAAHSKAVARPMSMQRLPSVSLIIAAHNEADVIAQKVANAFELHYPAELIEVIVASDGSTDQTAARARNAGAHVLDLDRQGKIRAQDRAVEYSQGEILAFSDANSFWVPEALARLVEAFADPKVGYACGQVLFSADEASTNQEGIYWRYEMVVRTLESRLSSVTAGNGAIYATRRSSYLTVDPRMGHDLSFPFNMVKHGWRAVYVSSACAHEKMVPSLEGEFSRKRRMMSHTWPIVVSGGMLSLRGYPPAYALEILSHRLLRYSTPFLHLVALGCNIWLLGASWLYTTTLALQLAVLASAALARLSSRRVFRLAYYYVLVTASPAAGLWDWLRTGTPSAWEKAEGTR
jgi:cellulose synthase/poly-beta-1,6-N-acetylglucosamine synthase-like glycosyltransferase